MEEFVRQALESFDRDPADSDYQEGYQNAFIDMQEFLNRQENS